MGFYVAGKRKTHGTARCRGGERALYEAKTKKPDEEVFFHLSIYRGHDSINYWHEPEKGETFHER